MRPGGPTAKMRRVTGDEDDGAGIGRRAFITGGAAALTGTGFLAGRSTANARTGAGTPPAPPGGGPRPGYGSWPAIRAQFAAPTDEVHLDGFVLAVPPAPVRRAVEEHRRGLGREGVAYLHEHQAAAETAVAEAAARHLGADPEQIALTDSTMRRVRLYDAPARASADEMAERLIAAVTPATRLVAVTWVHSSTGVKVPVRAIADRLEEINRDRPPERRALLAVDGVHGFGVEATRVSKLGCDLFPSGCHKWLYGPRGTGLLWGTDAGWKALSPVIPSFADDTYVAWIEGDQPPPTRGPAMTPGGFHSFEHRWALAEAFDFHRRIGAGRIEARIHALAAQLEQGIGRIRGATLHTPHDAKVSSGIVCFELAGMRPPEVVSRLRDRGVHLSVAPYATEYVRAGPPLWVGERGIERALAELRRAAA